MDLYEEKEKGYERQGEGQLLGYTGYRYDDISGTYFAQAREYQPEIGRFMSQNAIRGNAENPMTLNRYGYCGKAPVNWVDLDGNAAVYYLNNMDGAKFFGHAAVLIENDDGSSEFFSFMGIDNLKLTIQGHDVASHIGHEILSTLETEEFLRTGDIWIRMPDNTLNFDNYDRALRREITEEEKMKMLDFARV